MPPQYRANIDSARTERKIALGRLDGAELVAAYLNATSSPSAADATDWDLVMGILNAEFPPPPPIPADRRFGRRKSPTNPTGVQAKRQKNQDSRE